MERRGSQPGCLLKAVVIAALAGCVGVWYVVVPPIGGVQIPPGPVSTPAPEAENAAVEYRQAIAALGPFSQFDPKHPPKDDPLEDPWLWMDGRRPTRDELAGFDKRRAAFDHLKRGAARQRFRWLPPLGGERPPEALMQNQDEHIRVRELVMRACSAALARDSAGRPDDELALAAYRLGSDWASDPDSSLVPAMMSVACRQITAETLFRLIGSDYATEADCRKLALGVQRSSGLPLRPDLVFEADFHQELALYRKQFDDPGLTRGFAERTVLGEIREQRHWLDAHRAALVAYDARAWEQACDDYRCIPRGWTDWRWLVGHPLPHQMVGGVMMSFLDANIRHILPMMAVDRADASGLVAVACLRAYRLRHGSYPLQLGPAFADLGLATPVMGYRLEAQGPVAWLPGVDGVDDGGHVPYDRQDAQNAAVRGHDLVYRPGQVPLHLRFIPETQQTPSRKP